MRVDSAERYRLAQLLTPRGLAGAAAAGAAVVALGAAFVWTGGWLSPGRLTQVRVIDRFEQVNGPHPGFRRNHAKGLCFTGWFDSDGAAQGLSRAAVFRPGRTPVFGRYAFAGGQPYVADSPELVRSLAANFQTAGGEIWRTGMLDIPVFPVRDVRGFYEQLAATRPDPATGKPDPARLKPFLAAHPETVQALGRIKAQSPTSGFADAVYNSINAFELVDGGGRATAVRWSLVPEEAPAPPIPGAAAGDRNALFDQLIAQVAERPVRYRLVLTEAGPGDRTDDATVPWNSTRRVVAGVLTVAQVQDEAHGACRDVTFDPLILPRGIAASDDPLLSPRSGTYANAFVRRAGEPAPQPAVRIAR